MIKRILKYTFTFFMTAFMLLIFYLFIGGAICNDIKASRIEKTYASLELPENAELIETATYVGNTSGTGNHTEIWAGVLIYSELSKKEIEDFFPGYYICALAEELEKPDYLAAAFIPYGDFYGMFPALKTLSAGNGYYIISNYYDAFTQADMRGH